jgi:hypothetical protein
MGSGESEDGTTSWTTPRGRVVGESRAGRRPKVAALRFSLQSNVMHWRWVFSGLGENGDDGAGGLYVRCGVAWESGYLKSTDPRGNGRMSLS